MCVVKFSSKSQSVGGRQNIILGVKSFQFMSNDAEALNIS